MVKLWRIVYYWLPPLIWMVIIFYLSSQTRVEVTGKFFWDFLFFKSLHMIEYAALYFLLFRAFFSLSNKNLANNFKYTLPAMLAILYAFSDEIHQTYVPTRGGKISDVFIDTTGILIMYIYIKHNINLVRKIIK